MYQNNLNWHCNVNFSVLVNKQHEEKEINVSIYKNTCQYFNHVDARVNTHTCYPLFKNYNCDLDECKYTDATGTYDYCNNANSENLAYSPW